VILDHLERTQAAFLAAIDGLSEAQWRFTPALDRWSIAQIAEHVTLAERTTGRLLTTRLAEAPPPTLPYPPEQRRARLLRAVPDRSRRAQAPERIRPSGKWATLAETRDAFITARAALIAIAQGNDPALAGHVLPHPFLGDLDGHEWLLFTSLHLQRHTSQIDEVKQDRGYPGA
jgi:hypothetical protein